MFINSFHFPPFSSTEGGGGGGGGPHLGQGQERYDQGDYNDDQQWLDLESKSRWGHAFEFSYVKLIRIRLGFTV